MEDGDSGLSAPEKDEKDVDVVALSDVALLEQLGYKPTLSRFMSQATSAVCGITMLTPLCGGISGLVTALSYGGPAVAVWGWFAVAFFSIMVALGMAECASAYPTAGGMYHWVYILTESVWASFTFGWMELLGQVAAVSAVTFVWAQFAQDTILIATASQGKDQLMQPGPFVNGVLLPNQTTQNRLFALYTGCLVVCGLLNSLSQRALSWLTVLCAWFCLFAIITFTIIVPVLAPTHQSAKWVFTAWSPVDGSFYLGSHYTPAYSAILALLLPAYNFSSYDGPCHLSEECKDAARSAPRAILVAILSSAVTGWGLVIALCFSIQSVTTTLALTSDYDGHAPLHGLNSPAQILYDVFKAYNNRPYLANAVFFMPLVATFFCTCSLVTYVSRILFAYARDRAVPLSWLWYRVDERTGMPLSSVWGTCALAELLGLAILRDNYAINAILSLAVVALNICYIVPNLCRLTIGRKRFRPGPFTLGKWAYPVGALATLWVGFAVCIFSLPQIYPVTYRTLNYAGICWLATFLASQAAYFMPFGLGAKNYFRGPQDETHIRAWMKEAELQAAEAPRA